MVELVASRPTWQRPRRRQNYDLIWDKGGIGDIKGVGVRSALYVNVRGRCRG